MTYIARKEWIIGCTSDKGRNVWGGEGRVQATSNLRVVVKLGVHSGLREYLLEHTPDHLSAFYVMIII